MIVVQGKLISEEIVQEKFLCDLTKCKGACCWEGDMGAPLEEDELDILDKIYPKVRPFLSEEGAHEIDKHGCYDKYEDGNYGTSLLASGPCTFMTYDAIGVAQCGIEQAWKAGAVDFRKPISCHLYPIRVAKKEIADFEALNYDRWDICSAACNLGAKHQLPVYQFLKDALIRKYGEEFYEELDATAQYLKANPT